MDGDSGGTNIIAGGGFTLTVPTTGTAALTGLTLAQFAATTSAQLAEIISDETGTGLAVFATSPTLVTPILGVASATSLAVPAITTTSGALTVTPAAGSNLAIVLAGAGDFAVNTNQLYVDTSSGNVGIGMAGLGAKLDIDIGASSVDPYTAFRISRGIGIQDLLTATYSAGDTILAGALNNNFIIRSQGNTITSEGIFFQNNNGGSISNTMAILGSGNVGLGTMLPTYLLSFGGNAARTIWMERHTTANTAGNTLTVQAGGATSGATDKAGGDWIALPGVTTGTGRANIRLQNYNRGATGTADNTAVDRLIIPGAVTLTDAATSMFEVALASGAMCGGTILWTIRASNGTDHQAYSGITTYSAVNKAAVYTTAVTSDAANDAKSVSSGTLTAIFSILTGSSKITLQCSPTGSLTETTYTLNYTLINNSPAAITIL